MKIREMLLESNFRFAKENIKVHVSIRISKLSTISIIEYFKSALISLFFYILVDW